MTISEAKNLLDLQGDDPEEVKDRYEELLFQQVQIFLKDPVIPVIIAARAKKMKDLYEAYLILTNEKSSNTFSALELNSLSNLLNWKSFWESYEKNKSILRKAISRTNRWEELEYLLNGLEQNERDYSDYLLPHFIHFKTHSEAKLSEVVAVIEILKECENLKSKGLIDDTLVSFEKISENNSTFNLSKEVNRLRKMGKTIS